MPAYSLTGEFPGNWPGSAQGKPNPALLDAGTMARQDVQPNDYPVLDPATGKLVNVRTGKLWSGKNPWDQKTYQAGAVVPDANAIDPNNVAQRYKAVDVVKSPGVASATDELLKNFEASAKDSLKGFDDYLNNYRAATSQALKAGESATDIGPLTTSLRNQQTRYAGALTDSERQLSELNARDAAAQRGIVGQAQDILPQYDLAAQNIADRQLQELQKQTSRYKLGTGTPTSLGSDEERILAQGAADVLLPLEQAKIGRKYDLLTNLALPVERDITGRETSRISQFDPMVAGQQYQTGTDTERYLQSLKQQIATMDYADAEAYLRSLTIPEQIRNQLLAGQISTLGGISSLEDQSRYRGLQDVLGVNPSQPAYYNTGQPPYPSRYNLSGGGVPVGPTVTATGTLGPNAPTTVGGGLNYPAGEMNYLDPSLPPWILAQRRAALAQGAQPGDYAGEAGPMAAV